MFDDAEFLLNYDDHEKNVRTCIIWGFDGTI